MIWPTILSDIKELAKEFHAPSPSVRTLLGPNFAYWELGAVAAVLGVMALLNLLDKLP